jgi:two-component system, cell cycle response regulator
VTVDTARDTAELTPLKDRLALLLVVRLFMSAIVQLAAVVLPELPISSFAVLAAQLYACVAIGSELVHRVLTRFTSRRWLIVVNSMLLFDGIYVATVLADGGEARNVFIFLAYMHVVSVTLLIGFRTGLKIALWHSILLLTTYYLTLAGWLEALEQIGGNPITANDIVRELEVAQACALWVVAMVTAGFSSMNERELRRGKGELTIVAELTSAVERTRRPSEILAALVDMTIEKLGAHRTVAICFHGGKMVKVGGEDVELRIEGETLESVGGLVAKASADAKPVLVKRIDPGLDPVLAAMLPEARNVSVMPMIAEGDVVAVVASEWGSMGRITRQTIDLLSSATGRVALALSNTFLITEIQRLATVDGLTGMPNRRMFNTSLEREISRSLRNGQPVSLLMLDIDHFKSVNDTHGHQTGDQVLVETAAGVMAACRKEDIPARYGGEEMAVIMPNCGPEDALKVAERIRTSLKNANVTLKGVTASAGVATYPLHATSPDGLMKKADEALYVSKENGRNRTTLWSEPAEDPVSLRSPR